MFYSDKITHLAPRKSYLVIICPHLHNNVTKSIIRLSMNRCEHCFRPWFVFKKFRNCIKIDMKLIIKEIWPPPPHLTPNIHPGTTGMYTPAYMHEWCTIAHTWSLPILRWSLPGLGEVNMMNIIQLLLFLSWTRTSFSAGSWHNAATRAPDICQKCSCHDVLFIKNTPFPVLWCCVPSLSTSSATKHTRYIIYLDNINVDGLRISGIM